jgi:hypothetical protein
MKYHYAIDHGVIYRFDCPSDRDLWCAYADSRTRIASTHRLVVQAKVKHESGEPWPKPEMENRS